MSASNMSPWTNVALSRHAGLRALRFDSSTRSGLYSTPSARAPRFAAAITLRPSPEPRSITKSLRRHARHVEHHLDGVSGDGIQTTSLPSCPMRGLYGSAAG